MFSARDVCFPRWDREGWSTDHVLTENKVWLELEIKLMQEKVKLLLPPHGRMGSLKHVPFGFG